MWETYNLSYQITGLLISFHAFGSLISSFVGGIIPVYLGRKISILLLSSAAVIGFILMTLTGNPFFLLLAFFLTGINKGAISNFGNTIVNDIATGKAWAQNLLHSMFAIGAFVSPFVALFFTHGNTHGWVYAVLIWAFLCFTELIVLTRLKIPNNFPMHKKSRKMNLGFLKNKYYLTACLILFFYAAAEQSINGFLVTYFKDSGIMSGTFAQIMAGLLWVVIKNGKIAVKNPCDYQAMSEIMWCGSISHNELTGLGADTDFAPHQLGQELSGKFDVAHGASISTIWGCWAKYSYLAKPERFARFAKQVWGIEKSSIEESALAAIEKTVSYFASIGAPTCFTELGIGVQSEEILFELADRCVFYGSRTVGHFKVLNRDDVYQIYKMANH